MFQIFFFNSKKGETLYHHLIESLVLFLQCQDFVSMRFLCVVNPPLHLSKFSHNFRYILNYVEFYSTYISVHRMISRLAHCLRLIQFLVLVAL